MPSPAPRLSGDSFLKLDAVSDFTSSCLRNLLIASMIADSDHVGVHCMSILLFVFLRAQMKFPLKRFLYVVPEKQGGFR